MPRLVRELHGMEETIGFAYEAKTLPT